MTYGEKVQTHRDAYSLSPPIRFSRLGKTNLISTKAITLSQADWFLEPLIWTMMLYLWIHKVFEGDIENSLTGYMSDGILGKR